MPAATIPAVKLADDLGDIQVQGQRTIELTNLVHRNASYEAMRSPSVSFSRVAEAPLAVRTAVINEWAVSCVITPNNIYLYIPTARTRAEQSNFQVSVQGGIEFLAAVAVADVAFYQHTAYIATDRFPLLRIDLTDVQGDNLQGLNPLAVPVAGSPRAHILTAVDRFLVTGYNSRADEPGFNAGRIQWSAINNPLDWRLRTEEGTTTGMLSGDQYFQELQEVVAIGAQERNMVVFGRNAISLGTFIGGNLVYRFDTLADIGIVAKRAHATLAQTTYFLSSQGFFAIQGTQLQPIGVNAVNDSVLSRINWAAIDGTQATVDENITSILWSLPVDDSAVNNLLVIYNYLEDTWSTADVSAAAFIRYAAPAVSADSTAARNFDRLFTSAEAVPFSFDSPVWAGQGGSQVGFISSAADHPFTALGGEEKLPAKVRYPLLPAFSDAPHAAAHAAGHRRRDARGGGRSTLRGLPWSSQPALVSDRCGRHGAPTRFQRHLPPD